MLVPSHYGPGGDVNNYKSKMLLPQVNGYKPHVARLASCWPQDTYTSINSNNTGRRRVAASDDAIYWPRPGACTAGLVHVPHVSMPI